MVVAFPAHMHLRVVVFENVDIIGFHVVYENNYSLTSTKTEASTQIRLLYNTIGLAAFYF